MGVFYFIMDIQIVFSDVDGTLLDSRHRIQPATLQAIHTLQSRDIPFVIVSARSPAGIRPILEQYRFSCPMICFSGALTLDEKGAVLDSRGFSPALAKQVIDYLEIGRYPCTWNLFSGERWLVRDPSHPLVQQEEAIVHTCSAVGDCRSLAPTGVVHKLLLMCPPGTLEETAAGLQAAFPGLSVVASSGKLLEVMDVGINKGRAVSALCERLGIPPASAAAFGDHWNDMEMLSVVGHPVLMENAPKALRERFGFWTRSNDQDGIAYGLKKLGIL